MRIVTRLLFQSQYENIPIDLDAFEELKERENG